MPLQGLIDQKDTTTTQAPASTTTGAAGETTTTGGAQTTTAAQGGDVLKNVWKSSSKTEKIKINENIKYYTRKINENIREK
jgi:hypothetical protein